MGRRCLDPITSLSEANDCISRINGCETESDVEALATKLAQFFDLQDFIFSALHRCGTQEHYRYLFGCAPEWIYRYIQNRWYAIDPFVAYALQSTSPVLSSVIPMTSPGQQRMLIAANEHGLRSGIVVPAHSAATDWVGALFLVTNEGSDITQHSLRMHRYLMCALGLELLEWCVARHHANLLLEFDLDHIDVTLLRLAQANASTGDAACELGITLSLARWRYARLLQKFEVASKLRAVEKAVGLEILPPKR